MRNFIQFKKKIVKLVNFFPCSMKESTVGVHTGSCSNQSLKIMSFVCLFAYFSDAKVNLISSMVEVEFVAGCEPCLKQIHEFY